MYVLAERISWRLAEGLVERLYRRSPYPAWVIVGVPNMVTKYRMMADFRRRSLRTNRPDYKWRFNRRDRRLRGLVQ